MLLHGKLFQPGPMFAPKAKILPMKGALARRAPRVGFNLTREHETSLNRLARDKHSSLFCLFVGDEEKVKKLFCQ